MKILSYLFIILLTACLLSCSGNTDSKVEETSKSVEHSTVKTEVDEEEEEWIPDDYKTSELAELMRKMHTDHLVLKTRIEEGEINLLKESDYSSIHTATPTDSNDDTPLFQIYAKAYLLAEETVYKSKSTQEYKQSFNAMVNSCIGCHQNFCMGPIAKIELLRIQ